MTRCHLRVEAVNLSNFIDDSNDLSTIRGGGLLLLYCAKRVEECLEELNRAGRVATYRTVVSGASMGLFELDLPAPGECESIADSVREHLRKHSDLKHATFVVHAVEDQGQPYAMVVDRLVASNRWEQMRSLSVSLPEFGPQEGVNGVRECAYDGVRPAFATVSRTRDEGSKRDPVSAATKARFEFGRNQKKHFFQNEISRGRAEAPSSMPAHAATLVEDDALRSMDFTWSLGELANDANRGRLDGKMALIHFDGNGFTSIRNRTCRSADDFRAFDITAKSCMRRFLGALLSEMRRDPAKWAAQCDEKRLHRVEIMLWGGDEALFAVPAWCGWSVLSLFFKLQAQENWTFRGEPLRYAAGMVCCHSHAHIARIRSLTHELCELVKDNSRQRELPGDQCGRFAYLILESFDDTGMNLRQARLRRLGVLAPIRDGAAEDSDYVFAGDHAEKIASAMRMVQAETSRGLLHALVYSLVRPLASEKPHDTGKWKAAWSDGARSAFAELGETLFPRLAADVRESHVAYTLLELWDYVAS